MSLVFCVSSVFGILFVIRTLQIFRTRALISPKALTKIGTIAICGVLIADFSSFQWPTEALFLLFIAFLTPLPLLMFLERTRLQRMKIRVPVFLDRWIMNLKLGAASTPARDRSMASQSEDFQALMRPLFTSAKRFENATHPLLPLFCARELCRIQNEPHLALARLENLREVLRKSDDFRRKSGQATRQTAIQSVVMLLLYAALLIFTIARGGWRANSDLVLWSVLFTAIGVISMTFLAQKTRWKL